MAFVNVGPCIFAPSPRRSLILRQQLHDAKRQSYLNFQRFVGGSVEPTRRASSAAHISRPNRALPPPQKASNAGTTGLPDDVASGTTGGSSSATRATLGAESELGHGGDGRAPACATENLVDGRRAAAGGPPDGRGECRISFPDISIRRTRSQARLGRVE